MRLREAGRVDQHQCVELLGLFPERRKGRIGQLLAVDVGEDLDAFETELLHAALELLGRLVAVLHRHAAERHQPILVLAHILRDAVIERARSLHADVERQVIVDLRRRRTDELHVDAHLVHDGKALVRRGDARADIRSLFCHQRLGFRRRVRNQRIGRLLEMRCHDLRHARDRDMGVHIEGEAFRPDVPPGLAVLARSRVGIFVPDIRHFRNSFR